jgi:hypothetical protein
MTFTRAGRRLKRQLRTLENKKLLKPIRPSLLQWKPLRRACGLTKSAAVLMGLRRGRIKTDAEGLPELIR